MDLDGFWDATVGDLGLTSPLQDVGAAFTLQVWQVTRMNGDLWRLSALRYHDMIINEKLRANAERLRAPDGDPCDDYPAADGEASDNAVVEGGEHPHDGTEASPPDILDDFTAVEVFVVDVLRGLRTLSQRPAEASATTAPARAYHA
ncbi:hypothetical protein PPTG_17790 [Phytophthora nicotianae INRA-310]|uniref:Uncharacterized protein n=1 Tax=Phytophthora nicotianae (strain INRA-310) TaxID=761204 RepID=W2PIT7_PHYN3|nr:hypothetical protein PPTG_17790 [Phytophthora nicotianae INRA-310]ETN00913.1 hypothetical protein PPTG_17790 [Phytophthora nicotianae INRA-310]